MIKIRIVWLGKLAWALDQALQWRTAIRRCHDGRRLGWCAAAQRPGFP
ncbi:MAG: hypothetical protein WCN98_09930 [Verrucomicrobiaceae bacterium]